LTEEFHAAEAQLVDAMARWLELADRDA
jgi:hypothetical protein